ncbi:Fe-S cluster biogenesis protein NfuA [Bacteriovorax stolpii]|uniref:NifU family protein n=1 Tax=Bacteriovorax stolpii TaxID=960 RepID=UPI0010E1966A|nr:NifU family protein [Bacteriovorax stolpii]TDP51774.1 Fe-S cluster biogenesis protein NfuA [Bacteriovorax stolpii]
MTEAETNMEIDIDIQPTPNPNALKFILNYPVKNEGNSTYKSPSECGENKLALELFKVRGIDQLHFFENVIAVTKFSYEDWNNVEVGITKALKEFMPTHNPDYNDPNPEADRRKNLSPELQQIEAILDKTIRPGLQGDGGDIQALTYQDNILMVKYQGACGTCPSSTTGTLEAIKAILRDELNPDIEVYIAPEY